jgi:hypothetical protein
MPEHIIPLPHVKSFAPYAFRHGEEPLDSACPHRTVGPCANRSEAHPSRIRQVRSAEPAIWLRCGHLRNPHEGAIWAVLDQMPRLRDPERRAGSGPSPRSVRMTASGDLQVLFAYDAQVRSWCDDRGTRGKAQRSATCGNCSRYPRLGWRAREGPGLGQDGPKPGRPRITRTDFPRRSRSRTRGCDRFSPMRSARPGSESTVPSIIRSPPSRPCRPRA